VSIALGVGFEPALGLMPVVALPAIPRLLPNPATRGDAGEIELQGCVALTSSYGAGLTEFLSATVNESSSDADPNAHHDEAPATATPSTRSAPPARSAPATTSSPRAAAATAKPSESS